MKIKVKNMKMKIFDFFSDDFSANKIYHVIPLPSGTKKMYISYLKKAIFRSIDAFSEPIFELLFTYKYRCYRGLRHWMVYKWLKFLCGCKVLTTMYPTTVKHAWFKLKRCYWFARAEDQCIEQGKALMTFLE